MFGLSFIEIIVILLVAFIIFGPEQFPMMIKKIILAISTVKGYIVQFQDEFRRLSTSFEKELTPLNIAESLQKNNVEAKQEVKQKEESSQLIETLDEDQSHYSKIARKSWLDEMSLQNEEVHNYKKEKL